MIKNIISSILLCLFCSMPSIGFASKIDAHEVIYDEKEEGTDFYIVKYTVSDHLIRIDDSAEPDANVSGFIIFDLKKETIYSVSHFDETILVIPKYHHDGKDNNTVSKVVYEKVDDAPTISGKPVFNYKLMAETKAGFEKCMDLQIASGLLPGVMSKLKQYQTVVSTQQVKTIKTVPDEYQTPCYLLDQIYNEGDYYDKGLPLHEWHSNNRVRVLRSFDKVVVDKSLFTLPKSYKQFMLEELKH